MFKRLTKSVQAFALLVTALFVLFAGTSQVFAEELHRFTVVGTLAKGETVSFYAHAAINGKGNEWRYNYVRVRFNGRIIAKEDYVKAPVGAEVEVDEEYIRTTSKQVSSSTTWKEFAQKHDIAKEFTGNEFEHVVKKLARTNGQKISDINQPISRNTVFAPIGWVEQSVVPPVTQQPASTQPPPQAPQPNANPSTPAAAQPGSQGSAAVGNQLNPPASNYMVNTSQSNSPPRQRGLKEMLWDNAKDLVGLPNMGVPKLPFYLWAIPLLVAALGTLFLYRWRKSRLQKLQDISDRNLVWLRGGNDGQDLSSSQVIADFQPIRGRIKYSFFNIHTALYSYIHTNRLENEYRHIGATLNTTRATRNQDQFEMLLQFHRLSQYDARDGENNYMVLSAFGQKFAKEFLQPYGGSDPKTAEIETDDCTPDSKRQRVVCYFRPLDGGTYPKTGPRLEQDVKFLLEEMGDPRFTFASMKQKGMTVEIHLNYTKERQGNDTNASDVEIAVQG
jgi:hypothetical protein